jgi:hypothetical protein
MSAFEILMLVCFGVSWPVSIIKSYRSRTTKGKSLLFMCLILLGYLAGVTHKLLYSNDFVLVLYIVNALMVAADILLYFRNRAIMRQKERII